MERVLSLLFFAVGTIAIISFACNPSAWWMTLIAVGSITMSIAMDCPEDNKEITDIN